MKKLLLPIAVLFYSLTAICQNPQFLKDVYPGSTGSGIQQIVKTSNYTFFNAEDDDADADRGLYRTDGTPAGTIKLNLTYPTYISTKAEKLTALGDKIIFAGDNFANYGEIWVSDGTQSGTIALERFQPSSGGKVVMDMTRLATNVLYGVMDGNNHSLLKKTDGTPGGTSVVYDFSSFASPPDLALFQTINNILYFNVYDIGGSGIDQLWRSDGTTAGTYMLKDFGLDQYVASTYMTAGDLFYWMVVKPGTGNVLWKSDGTAAGTVSVKTIGTTGNNNYPHNAAIGSTLYFAGLDGNGKELWKTDGTEAGTMMVQNINAGPASSNPTLLTALNNNLYFYADGGLHGNELWKFDGTSATEVLDIYPGSTGSKPLSNASIPAGFVESNGSILFNAANDATGQELWITDGTAANTKKIRDINPLGASSPSALTPGNPVYFSANNGVNGTEIFKYDNSEGISGLNKIYVNDNSAAGDLFTTAVGNDANPGTKASPVATLTYALSIANEGDTIYVDSGTYTEQITITKGISIIGAGKDLTSILKPDVTVAPPGPFTEQGVFQTAQNIGDVFIENMSITGGPDVTPIIIQSGGTVKNCKLQNGNQGIFFRVESSAKTAVIENNIISAEYIGVNFQGSGLTASLINNTITVTNQGFSAGIFAGLDFGPLPQLTSTGNSISNYATYAFNANSYNSNITQNSIVGNGLAFNTNTVLQATCNWFGTSDAEVIKSKIVGNVNYVPWLVNGTDNEPSNPGFQAVPDSCTGRQNKFYVNDNNQTGDVLTTAIGNNANNGFSTAPFATINYAVSQAQNGDTIIVDAGTYAERIFVNKSLNLKGANAGNNPGTSLNRGLSESILLPSTESNTVEIMTVQATDVSIDGFLFEGDNPEFTGSVTLNGIDVNAGMGIYNGNLGTNNLAIKNNIFKNFFRYGMLLQSNTAALTGINVSRNHVDNISSKTPRDGRGIGLFNNAYATVTDNYLTRVNTGVIMANFNVASADSVVIESNTIEAYSYGIIANGNSNLTSPVVINNNQLTVSNLAVWLAPGSSTVNNCFGVGVFNLTSTKNVSITNNTIAGTRTGINTDRIVTPEGIQVNGGTISNSSNIGLFHINRGIGAAKLTVNNISLINNVVGMDASAADTNNMQLEFSGVAIDGGTTGIRFYGQSISLPSNKLSGVSFSNQTKEYILLTTNSFIGKTIDVSTVSFDSVTPNNMTLAQLFATEDKLTHKIDINYVGYFKLKPNEVFVTPNSFAADIIPVFGTPTSSPEINRAVGVANTGDIIHVQAGTYVNQINIDKAITIKGEGKELTHIQGPSAPIMALPDFDEKGIIQSLSGIGDVNIEDLSIDGTNSDELHSILIQGGGTVINCEMKNANNGIFFRDRGNVQHTALASGNFIHDISYVGLNFAGAQLNGHAINNVVDLTGASYGMGFIVGFDFGPLEQFTATNNEIKNHNGWGFNANSNNGEITNNSITGSAGFAIQQSSGNALSANCNWFGTANKELVESKINGNVDTTPWLTNGTDSDLVSYGFQPLPNVCNGLPLTVTLDASENITCKGANNGTINTTVSNGVAPYTFLWTNIDVPEFSSSSEGLANLEPGTYQLLLTDSNGSTASLSDMVISEPDLLTALASGTNNICFGASEATANVTASGGTLPYTYLWSNSETTDEISNLAAGTYSVTVSDANGCTAIASYEVTQPTMLTATIANNSTICSNNAMVTAGAGTPGYTFLWSNGATTASINNVPIGTYSVAVTDTNGCTTTASIALSVGEAFNPSAASTNVSCFGASNGAITITNANGTAPFTFSKDGGAFLSGALPYSFNNLSAGNYEIAVKDNNGCVGFVTKTVTQPALLSATIITVQSTCSGQSTGSISVATSGGSGGLSYSWTRTGGGYASTQKNISGLAAGSYVLIVKDSKGCIALLDVVVPNSNPITVSETITNVLCRGTLTGAINLTVSGGSGSGFAYSWTGGTIATSKDISNIGAGSSYKVTITDIGSGCIVSKSYIITQPTSNLVISTSKTNSTGCNSLGTITATGSGGMPAYTYSINGINYQATNTFTGLLAGSYTAWVKDANGCAKSSALISITDNGTDAYESNNSKSQAKLIAIGTTINARIALATDTADWFKFTTPAGNGNYKLSLSHQSVNYTFNMYPTANNSAALAPSSSTATSKQYALAGGTTYYVQITGALSYNCYDLSILPVSSSAKYASTNTKVIATNELSVKAYPNPHEGLFNLAIKSPEDGTARIQLFTILGQILATRDVSLEKGQNTIVEFNDVGRGMILYHITIGSQEVNGKVFGKD